MLIQLQDALKPYQNRKLQHRGLVVDVEDPLHLGRIKCKVEGVIESDDLERLPWCYPKEGISRGGRKDSCETAVPPLYSLVMIEFPGGGDSPVGGGNVYYPVWSGMQRVDLTNPEIGVTNPVTEDSGLSEPYGGGDTPAEDLEVDVWVKKQSQNVCWIRVDKFLGSIELFDQDSDSLIRLDRGGHLQLFITSLDVVTRESVRFDVGGNFHAKVAGETFFDSQGDIGMKTASNFARNVAGDIDDYAAGEIRETAGGSLGLRAGSDLGAEAGGNLGLKSGGDMGGDAGGSIGFSASENFGASAGVSMAFYSDLDTSIVSDGSIASVAGVIISETAPIIAEDAAYIAEDEGLALGPLSDPPSPPGTPNPLTVNATVMQELAVSNDDVVARAEALERMAHELLAAAEALKAAGQEVAEKIKAWADELVGKDI